MQTVTQRTRFGSNRKRLYGVPDRPVSPRDFAVDARVANPSQYRGERTATWQSVFDRCHQGAP
jgi:hypothetical protein